MVVDSRFEGGLPEGVGGAGVAGVVGPERHLDKVEQSVGYLAVLDHGLGGLVYGHRNGRGVVVGRNDEVDFGQDAVGIGPVIVDERAARRPAN